MPSPWRASREACGKSELLRKVSTSEQSSARIVKISLIFPQLTMRNDFFVTKHEIDKRNSCFASKHKIESKNFPFSRVSNIEISIRAGAGSHNLKRSQKLCDRRFLIEDIGLV